MPVASGAGAAVPRAPGHRPGRDQAGCVRGLGRVRRARGDKEEMLTPYYQDDSVTIYHGDCQQLLDGLSPVDITVTSPPYNIDQRKRNAHRSDISSVHVAKWKTGYSDSMEERAYQEWLRGIIGKCIRLSRGLVWMNHKVRYRDGEAIHPLRFMHFPCYAEVIWDRGISMMLNCKRYAPSHEGLWAFGAPHYWDDRLNTRMSVWRLPPQRSKDHPCPFPLELVSPLIVSSCPINGTCLDPFSGSGTTLRAAKNLNRKAIGIEKEERYCEIAAQRMRQEVLPLC